MAPTTDEQDDFLLACRYGDLDDVKQFVDQYGVDAAASVRDDNGNTALHMICGNGHSDLLDYMVSIVPPSLLSSQNTALSTPLHWAALNSHLDVMKKLVEFPKLAGWDEGAQWLVQMMNLDPEGGVKEGESDADPTIGPEGIEIEIEDADGQMAKMQIGGQSS
ncbi:hypothetical protein FB45DRAFT_894730 [Roridomyces roridus]|uniref:Ankyrin n=1 Tax=Roridomyces roridus TaxID=1738132 RepID=A0AAD7CGF6_9AGAR|nr:hypothetical protein FB45DRAFT_894730 [Roridomyces roridus]